MNLFTLYLLSNGTDKIAINLSKSTDRAFLFLSIQHLHHNMNDKILNVNIWTKINDLLL